MPLTKLPSASSCAIGAFLRFLQTPAPVLDKISGPIGTRILSSTGLQFGTLIGRAQFLLPALDKNQSANVDTYPSWFGQILDTCQCAPALCVEAVPEIIPAGRILVCPCLSQSLSGSFPDSSSVLDKFLSTKIPCFYRRT